MLSHVWLWLWLPEILVPSYRAEPFPNCRHGCNVSETAEHILLDCPFYVSARNSICELCVSHGLDISQKTFLTESILQYRVEKLLRQFIDSTKHDWPAYTLFLMTKSIPYIIQFYLYLILLFYNLFLPPSLPPYCSLFIWVFQPTSAKKKWKKKKKDFFHILIFFAYV